MRDLFLSVMLVAAFILAQGGCRPTVCAPQVDHLSTQVVGDLLVSHFEVAHSLVGRPAWVYFEYRIAYQTPAGEHLIELGVFRDQMDARPEVVRRRDQLLTAVRRVLSVEVIEARCVSADPED